VSSPPGLLTIDVEDWFHSENLLIPPQDWENQQPRVSDNLKRLLALLERYKVKGTFFVLGWVAQRYPHLVTEIQGKGHEIACHGYNHQLVYKLSKAEFRADIKRAKALLEDITGEEIIGYRASNFSITDWAIKILQQEGFLYDSSLYPVSWHDRYGRLNNYQLSPDDDIVELEPGFWEVTVPTLKLLGLSLPWGGGGYFRLLPYPIFKAGILRLLKRRHSFLFYLHPREIDPEQPRLNNIPKIFGFRHYVGLRGCETKLTSLLSDFQFLPIRDRLSVASHQSSVISRIS